MNNWLKIGLPVLVAVLLVISAVAITLAVTSGNPSNRVAAASYTTPGTSEAQLASGPNCPNCPGYGKGDTGESATGTQGSCCSTDSTGVYVPKTNTGGGCCRGR